MNVYFSKTEEPLNGISGNSYTRTVYPSEKSSHIVKCPTSGTKFSLSLFEGITSYHKNNLNLNFLRARRHIRLEHHSSIGAGLRLHGMPLSSSSNISK